MSTVAQAERAGIGVEEKAAGMRPTRVAYFPDSFHEINGVAHTSRQWEAFARRRNLPFLCVRAGVRAQTFVEEGNLWTLELPRGFLSFALEKDLRFDPAFLRHFPLIEEVIERFKPELIHITGPSELGMLGAALAHHRKIPLTASWHTHVHEYLARRSEWFLRLLPERQSRATAQKIEEVTLSAASLFYGAARVLFAPTDAFCAKLSESTGRPCRRMARGVDAVLFHPDKRERDADDQEAVLGFVGRLSVEKNVALLASIQKTLDERGKKFRFRIVGQGGEIDWLRERLPRAEFTGVLRGEELARAYAGMDLFVFPSHTDTFGNVVLEALASGVPAIVTRDGGPCTIVQDGKTGRVADDEGFAAAIEEILEDPEQHRAMRRAARAYAETATWDAIFEGVYRTYEEMGLLSASADILEK